MDIRTGIGLAIFGGWVLITRAQAGDFSRDQECVDQEGHEKECEEETMSCSRCWWVSEGICVVVVLSLICWISARNRRVVVLEHSRSSLLRFIA